MYKRLNLCRVGRKLSTCNLPVYPRSVSSVLRSQGIATKRPDKSTHKVSFERSGDSLTGDRKETGSSKQDRLPGTTGHDVSGSSRSYTGGTGVDSSSRPPAQGDDRNGTVSSTWSRYVGENDRPERMAYYGLIIVCTFFAILSGCPIFVD